MNEAQKSAANAIREGGASLMELLHFLGMTRTTNHINWENLWPITTNLDQEHGEIPRRIRRIITKRGLIFKKAYTFRPRFTVLTVIILMEAQVDSK